LRSRRRRKIGKICEVIADICGPRTRSIPRSPSRNPPRILAKFDAAIADGTYSQGRKLVGAGDRQRERLTWRGFLQTSSSRFVPARGAQVQRSPAIGAGDTENADGAQYVSSQTIQALERRHFGHGQRSPWPPQS